jgi:hypothetical protein
VHCRQEDKKKEQIRVYRERERERERESILHKPPENPPNKIRKPT